MSPETSVLLNRVAVGVGVLTMVWATIMAGIQRKKMGALSGWSQSFVQATARCLTKTQKIAFFASMGCAILTACIAALLRS